MKSDPIVIGICLSTFICRFMKTVAAVMAKFVRDDSFLESSLRWADVNAGSWRIRGVQAVTILLRVLVFVRLGEERAGGLSLSGAAAGYGKSPPKDHRSHVQLRSVTLGGSDVFCRG